MRADWPDFIACTVLIDPHAVLIELDGDQRYKLYWTQEAILIASHFKKEIPLVFRLYFTREFYKILLSNVHCSPATMFCDLQTVLNHMVINGEIH